MKITALRKNHRTIFFIIAILLLCLVAECFISNYPYFKYVTKGDNGASAPVASLISDEEYKITKTKNKLPLTALSAPLVSISFETVGETGASYGVGFVSLIDENFSLLSKNPSQVEADKINSTTIYLDARDVANLTMEFSGFEADFTVRNIRINPTYKFSFSILRFVVLAIISLSLYLFSRLNIKDKYFYELGIEKKRTLAVILCLCSVIIALFVGCLLSQKGGGVNYPLDNPPNTYNNPYIQQYDAYKKGQLHIDFVPTDDFLALENPYDFDEREGTYYLWDRAYYNECFYSYFGIAPIITVYAPYEILFSELPNDNFVMTVFGVIASLFFCLSILAFADVYKQKIPIPMLILGIFSGLFSTALFLIMRGRAPYYYIAVLSAMAFLYCLLFFAILALSRKRGSASRYICLALASLSFSLLFLSRLNLAIGAVLLIIPYILFFIMLNKENRTRKVVLFELCSLASFVFFTLLFTFWYNFARFENIFEFGAKYQLTVSDISKNKIELSDMLPAISHYIVAPFKRIADFPFLELDYKSTAYVGKFIYTEWSFGILAIPLSFALLYGVYLLFAKRTSGSARALLACGLSSLIIISLVNFSLGGVMFRYTADLTAFSAPMALLLLISLCDVATSKELATSSRNANSHLQIIVKKLLNRRTIAYTVSVLLLVWSLIVSFAITVSSNPNLADIPSRIYNSLYSFFVFWR